MNAAQRRKLMRAIDRAFPPGSLAVDGNGQAYRVRPRRTEWERAEFDRVMVEHAVNPFGHLSARWHRLRKL